MSKVILITGASSGIGAALAQESPRSSQLFLVARREERLAALAQTLNNSGRKTHFCSADITDPNQLRAAVEKCVSTLGPPSIVVANAGFGVFGRVDQLQTEDFRRQFEINYFAALETFYATRAHLESTRGQFVLMGSVMSYMSTPLGAPYASSKFALRALSEALYQEMRSRGVAVTLLCPGLVESEFRFRDNFQKERVPLDPAPRALTMPAPLAARKMWKAIRARKREAVITGHGRFAVFLVRHFPNLFQWIVRIFGIKARRSID